MKTMICEFVLAHLALISATVRRFLKAMNSISMATPDLSMIPMRKMAVSDLGRSWTWGRSSFGTVAMQTRCLC
jgi:hypothetical protein